MLRRTPLEEGSSATVLYGRAGPIARAVTRAALLLLVVTALCLSDCLANCSAVACVQQLPVTKEEHSKNPRKSHEKLEKAGCKYCPWCRPQLALDGFTQTLHQKLVVEKDTGICPNCHTPLTDVANRLGWACLRRENLAAAKNRFALAKKTADSLGDTQAALGAEAEEGLAVVAFKNGDLDSDVVKRMETLVGNASSGSHPGAYFVLGMNEARKASGLAWDSLASGTWYTTKAGKWLSKHLAQTEPVFDKEAQGVPASVGGTGVRIRLSKGGTTARWSDGAGKSGAANGDFVPVSAGQYSITVSAPGFEAVKLPRVAVEDGEVRYRNVKMSVGSTLTGTFLVTAEASGTVHFKPTGGSEVPKSIAADTETSFDLPAGNYDISFTPDDKNKSTEPAEYSGIPLSKGGSKSLKFSVSALVGTLYVSTPGLPADVYLDGQRKGATNEAISVPPATYSVEVRVGSKGSYSFGKQTVAANETQKLELGVISVPDTGLTDKITIERVGRTSVDCGTSPVTVPVEPGDYTVTASAPECKDVSKTLPVGVYGVTTFEVVPKPAKIGKIKTAQELVEKDQWGHWGLGCSFTSSCDGYMAVIAYYPDMNVYRLYPLGDKHPAPRQCSADTEVRLEPNRFYLNSAGHYHLIFVLSEKGFDADNIEGKVSSVDELIQAIHRVADATSILDIRQVEFDRPD